MKRLVAFVFIIITLSAYSQNKNNDEFTTKNHYYFNEFMNGIVTFNDGRQVRATLNYSVLYNELHFIQDQKVMVLDGIDLVKNVRIEGTDFIPFKNKIYILLYIKDYKLVKQKWVDYTFKENRSVIYGSGNQTASVEKYNGIDQEDNISLQNNNNFKEESIKVYDLYYVIDGKKLIKVNKKNILKLHKRNQDLINSYITENNIDFNKEKDIIDLITYCNQLK